MDPPWQDESAQNSSHKAKATGRAALHKISVENKRRGQLNDSLASELLKANTSRKRSSRSSYMREHGYYNDNLGIFGPASTPGSSPSPIDLSMDGEKALVRYGTDPRHGLNGTLHLVERGQILATISPNVLPVAKSPEAQKAFDFYINSYLPGVLEIPRRDTIRFPQLVQQSLTDPLLFTAFTTTSEATRWRTQSLFGDAPKHVMNGYGRTISMLSERLKNERFAMTNAVMMTMAQLTAIETMTKNVSASNQHLAGMQQVMKMQAQKTTGPAAGHLMAAVKCWEAYFRKREEILQSSPRWKPIVYPSHPFSSKVSMSIATLPVGFGDIALAGSLSTQTLDLLDGFDIYFKALNKMVEEGSGDSPARTMLTIQQAAVCIDFVQIQSLNPVEQLIAVALIAHVVRRDRLTPALTNLRNYFQLYCGFLSNVLGESGLPLNEPDHENDLLKWVGALLLVTSSTDSFARILSLKLLPKTPRPPDIIRASQMFFWDDAMTSLLLSGNTMVVVTSNDVVANNLKKE